MLSAKMPNLKDKLETKEKARLEAEVEKDKPIKTEKKK